MSLSGSIRDFGIPDIFQLISQQQKTGVLDLTYGEVEGQVVFDKGRLVLARFTSGYNELLLGQLLQRAGLVSEQQLKIGMENQKKTLRSLGDILIGMQVVSAAQLSAVLELQRQEVLFHIFQMRDGTYHFRNENFQYNPRIIRPANTAHILMDGVRMLDEWPGILRQIGSLQRVFIVTEAGRRLLEKVKNGSRIGGNLDDEVDAAFRELDAPGAAAAADSEEAVPLTEMERDLLLLIDGRRDLSVLIGLSLKGQFNTCQTALALLEKGLISELSSRAPGRAAEEVRPPAPLSAWSTAGQTIAFVVGLFSFAALVLFLGNRLGMAPLKNSAAQSGLSVPSGAGPQELRWPLYLGRVRAALEVFYLTRGLYPLDLRQLISEGLVGEQDVRPLEERGFFYQSRGNSFEIGFSAAGHK